MIKLIMSRFPGCEAFNKLAVALASFLAAFNKLSLPFLCGCDVAIIQQALASSVKLVNYKRMMSIR